MATKLSNLEQLIRKSERIRRQLGEKSSMQFVAARAIPNNGGRTHQDYIQKKAELERTERAINHILKNITGAKERTKRPTLPH